MPAYWRGAMTPHQEDARTSHLTQLEVAGYDNMKDLVMKLDAGNIHTDQIVLLFTASKSEPGMEGMAGQSRSEIKLTDKSGSKLQRTWNTDCDIFEEVVQLLHTKVINPAPVGWLVKVRVTYEEWHSERCPYKYDEEFRLRELPTMLIHNTMKRISGRKAFNMDNIITVLED